MKGTTKIGNTCVYLFHVKCNGEIVRPNGMLYSMLYVCARSHTHTRVFGHTCVCYSFTNFFSLWTLYKHMQMGEFGLRYRYLC